MWKPVLTTGELARSPRTRDGTVLHHAHAPPILDHPRALTQRDGGARPASAGGVVCRQRDLIILNAGDVLDNALAVRSVHGSMRKVKCVRVTAIAPDPLQPWAHSDLHVNVNLQGDLCN